MSEIMCTLLHLLYYFMEYIHVHGKYTTIYCFKFLESAIEL